MAIGASTLALGRNDLASADDLVPMPTVQARPLAPANIAYEPVVASWTLGVVTSPSQPASKAFVQSLRANPWLAANTDRIKLAEISLEVPGLESQGGAPSVLLYHQNAKGFELVGGRSSAGGVDEIARWARSFVVAGQGARDPNLAQVSHDHWGQPTASGQAGMMQPQPPYSTPTASTPAPAAAMMPLPQTATMMLPMSAGVANVVQAPQQSILVQQPPAQVMFAPQTAPIVYVPQASYAPQVSAPMGNLYMAGAPTPNAGAGLSPLPTAGVPMAMGTMTPVSAPMAAASVAPVAMATGPMLAGASLTTSSVSVPASSTSSRVRVRGPGPIASGLARLGERMTGLGRTKIETVQETRLNTQTSQSPPGQYMTLSSTSASPVMHQQPNATMSIPAASGPTCLPPLPPQQYGPPATQASPQGGR